MNELHVTFDGHSFRFPPGQLVRIGRSPDSSIVVSDPAVSRQHALVSQEQGSWVFANVGRAATFLRGQQVSRVAIDDPVQLVLASLQGPVLHVQAGPVMTGPTSTGSPVMGAQPPTEHGPDGAAGRPPTVQQPRLPDGAPSEPSSPEARGGLPAGARRVRPPGSPTTEDLAMALEILVPVRSWVKNPGWHQLVRLLVIPYGLLPLVFFAVFASSQSLTTPGWVYSLYVAPLWAIAFWLLIRPGPIKRQEVLIGAGIVVWTLIWIPLVTININDHLGRPNQPLGLFDALGVGINEEATKALPVLLAALLILRFRSVKLGVRMCMFLGTIVGLTFGVVEAALYTPGYIVGIHTAMLNSQAVASVLLFADRVFVDGFDHAIWAGVSAFFIGVALNFPRRRVPLILLGLLMAAVLHGLNDWTAPHIWVQIVVQGISLFMFLGYTMSATSIERQVRRTPIFRGESMIMDRFSDTGEMGV